MMVGACELICTGILRLSVIIPPILVVDQQGMKLPNFTAMDQTRFVSLLLYGVLAPNSLLRHVVPCQFSLQSEANQAHVCRNEHTTHTHTHITLSYWVVDLYIKA